MQMFSVKTIFILFFQEIKIICSERLKDGGFTFSYVDRLYFSYQKINLKRAGS